MKDVNVQSKGEVDKLTAREIKEAVLRAKQQKPEPVEVWEFAGVTGYLFKAKAKQMARYRRLMGDDDPDRADLGPALLIAICFRDHAGTPVWDIKNDLTTIAGLDDDIVEPCFRRCLYINGYGVEATEDIVKNLLRIVGVDGLYALLASMGAPCPSCMSALTSESSESNTSPSNIGPTDTPPTTSEPS
jgi:hypothetical protein